MADWLVASIEERKALYSVVKHLKIATRLDWRQFMLQTINRHVGEGFDANFRAGKISRLNAAEVYAWMRVNHPSSADTVDHKVAAIYGAHTPAAWSELVTLHGEFGRVNIVPFPRPVQWQQRQLQIHVVREPPPVSLPVENLFGFRLESPIAGDVLSFQWLQGRWSPMPLSAERIGETIEAGSQSLPRKPTVIEADRYQDFAYEHHGMAVTSSGLYRLAFLILPPDTAGSIESGLFRGSAIHDAFLNEIASTVLALPRPSWRLLKANVMFLETAIESGFDGSPLLTP